MTNIETISKNFGTFGWKSDKENTNILLLGDFILEIDIFNNSTTPYTEIDTSSMAEDYPLLVLKGTNWNNQLRKHTAIRQRDPELYNILLSISAGLALNNLGIGGGRISLIVVSFDRGYIKFVPDETQLIATSTCSGDTYQILFMLRKNN